MTVRELIEELEKHPSAYEIVFEDDDAGTHSVSHVGLLYKNIVGLYENTPD